MANMTPYLILAGIAGVALYMKGYISLPTPAKPSGQSSKELAVAFAAAIRREAEAEIAEAAADKAAEVMRAQFTAPFSAPGQNGLPSAPEKQA